MTAYTVRVHRLDPTLAELHVEFHDLPPGAEVRGRLMGPRCPGVSTVEVAYHLQPTDSPAVYRVLIPEPLFWTEERPCVYEGPVEIRGGGNVISTLSVSVGVKGKSD